MTRTILMTAALTGVFCAGFAIVVDWVTDRLELHHVIAISFVSGSLGSLFAQTVLGRWSEPPGGQGEKKP